MTFFTAIKVCFRQYATFSGRASRSEYWWYLLFLNLLLLAASALDMAFFPLDPDAQGFQPSPFTNVLSLATLLPTLAVSWRRLHDSGRPGYYLLVLIAGAIGGGIVVGGGVLWLLPSDAGLSSQQAGAGVLLMNGVMLGLIVAAVMLWWMTRPSDTTANRFGPVPE
ncbi:DUF805 domain-containing protein [Salinicola avicenniae]|uniref:DUF805 domain-containing protein n=1 Tax=Salinicola avicenniae TaxID=2916836 RepID=UPI002072DAC7|nr:DUF805 domain-containing protein [Salinicola sp. S1-1-8]